MPAIKFVTADGATTDVDATIGSNLMQVARDNDIREIEAECGGACSCATCHCYVDENWIGAVEPASAVEKDMLGGVIDPKPNSRLACQIMITAALDGLVVRLPKSQY